MSIYQMANPSYETLLTPHLSPLPSLLSRPRSFVCNFGHSRFRGGWHLTKSTNHEVKLTNQKRIITKQNSSPKKTISKKLYYSFSTYSQTTYNKQPIDFWTIYLQQAFHYTSKHQRRLWILSSNKNHHQISNTKEAPLQSHNDNLRKDEDDHEHVRWEREKKHVTWRNKTTTTWKGEEASRKTTEEGKEWRKKIDEKKIGKSIRVSILE
jgi:hypothetical protein